MKANPNRLRGDFAPPLAVILFTLFLPPILANAQEQLPLLDLSFEGTLIGADGEIPTQSDHVVFSPTPQGQGITVQQPGFLHYEVDGNIRPEGGGIEVWVQRKYGNDFRNHFVFFAGQKWSEGVEINIDQNRYLRFLTWHNGVEYNISHGIGDWELDGWHFIQAEWGPDGLRLFVDGEPAGTSQLPGYETPDELTVPIYVASNPFHVHKWPDIVIDSFKIYGPGYSGGGPIPPTPTPGPTDLPPTQPMVQILPEEPTPWEDLVCEASGSYDPEGEPVTYRYEWFRDGALLANESSFALDSSLTANGQLFECVVTPNDGTLDGPSGSDSVRVLNKPPSPPLVEILPTDPTTLDNLVCDATGSVDPEGRAVAYRYQWFRDGEPLTDQIGPLLDRALTTRDQTFECRVTPGDGEVEGNYASASVTIRNLPPSRPVIQILPERPTPRDGLAVRIVTPSVDPDGDEVIYLFHWYESADGIVWTRRPELSGNLRPFFPGQVEISSLYTQVAEYWRVEVIPVEAHSVSKKGQKAPQGDDPVMGDSGTDTALIWAELVADPESDTNKIDARDLLAFLSFANTPKGNLPVEIQGLFFNDTAPATSEIDLRQFLHLTLHGWHREVGD